MIVLGPNDCLCAEHRKRMLSIGFVGALAYVSYNGAAIAGPFSDSHGLAEAEAWARKFVPVSPFCRHEEASRQPTVMP